MKILYAIQGTGNGHTALAEDIVPLLKEYGDLDIFVSGAQSDIELSFPVKYKSKGLSFFSKDWRRRPHKDVPEKQVQTNL